MNNLVQFFFGKNLPKNENIVQDGLYFIEAGKLYIAKPPLYQQSVSNIDTDILL